MMICVTDIYAIKAIQSPLMRLFAQCVLNTVSAINKLHDLISTVSEQKAVASRASNQNEFFFRRSLVRRWECDRNVPPSNTHALAIHIASISLAKIQLKYSFVKCVMFAVDIVSSLSLCVNRATSLLCTIARGVYFPPSLNRYEESSASFVDDTLDYVAMVRAPQHSTGFSFVVVAGIHIQKCRMRAEKLDRNRRNEMKIYQSI